MAAAENDALPRGKVGGVADVIRDVPLALAELGHAVDVLTPCYGTFSQLPDAEQLAVLEVPFAATQHRIELFVVPSHRKRHANVRNLVVRSDLFAQPRPGQIYCSDPERPFATDATRFALFSRGILELIKSGALPTPDVMHLHDWHSALVLVLRAYDPRYAELRNVRTVFSIHNLALQGIRPFGGDASSLSAWFPGLAWDREPLVDPRYGDCINPLRAAINLADKVHTVSPSYAQEVLRSSDPSLGFVGGEGLEGDLQRISETGKLVGILNGTDYDVPVARKPKLQAFLGEAEREVRRWVGYSGHVRSADWLAWQRLRAWLEAEEAPDMLMTSIGRLTSQKVSLLALPWVGGGTVLDALLDILGNKARLMVIGSGDPELEALFVRAASEHDNFVFLNGYAESLAEQLYLLGDLFLMPSSFEPCGISQMLAMRAGQPCLVHAVGGLRDTVENDVTGFTFEGDSPEQQAEALLARVASLLRSQQRSPRKWSAIRKRAAAKRFLWTDTAQQYLDLLYQ